MEEWRDILGFEGLYQISNLARVKSMARLVRARGMRPVRERIMKLGIQPNAGTPYHVVTLRKDGKSYDRKVSHLVADAFIGPRPPGHVVRHGPGGSLDDHANNLQYGTVQENVDDTLRAGRRWSKLTEGDVIAIRASGESRGVLATRYGVHKSTITFIILRYTWKHV